MTADGFGPHKMTLKAQQVFLLYRIILLIEEGDSSHVCQPFDRTVARSGKCSMRDVLGTVLRTNVFGPCIDQYALVLVALAGLRAMRGLKESEPCQEWVSSFKATNLNPDCRLGFVDWLKKIKPFLAAGSRFQDDMQQQDKRKLLPDWWQLRSEEEKSVVIVVPSRILQQ